MYIISITKTSSEPTGLFLSFLTKKTGYLHTTWHVVMWLFVCIISLWTHLWYGKMVSVPELPNLLLLRFFIPSKKKHDFLFFYNTVAVTQLFTRVQNIAPQVCYMWYFSCLINSDIMAKSSKLCFSSFHSVCSV